MQKRQCFWGDIHVRKIIVPSFQKSHVEHISTQGKLMSAHTSLVPSVFQTEKDILLHHLPQQIQLIAKNNCSWRTAEVGRGN